MLFFPQVLKLEPGLSQAAPPYVGGGPGGHFAVKTRGLPYEATKNEIIQFLESCKIRNGQEGVHILVAVDGRPNGEAIVELESRMDVDNALKCHNRNMGRRYVEVSEISREEMNWELSRQPGVVSWETAAQVCRPPWCVFTHVYVCMCLCM